MATTKKTRPSNSLVDKILADAEAIRLANRQKQIETYGAEAVELFDKTTNGNAPKLDSETVLGRIEREGGTSYDRIGKWKPKMVATDDLPLAAEIAEAKQRIESDRLRKMTDAERELYFLEKRQAELVAAEQINADHQKRLADPKYKAVLEKLRALDENTASDESWTWDDTVAIARAIFALETPGSDIDAALALADEAFTIDKRKKQEAMTEREKEVARIRAEIEALADPTETEVEPSTEPESESELETPFDDVRKKLDALLSLPVAKRPDSTSELQQ